MPTPDLNAMYKEQRVHEGCLAEKNAGTPSASIGIHSYVYRHSDYFRTVVLPITKSDQYRNIVMQNVF